MKTIRTEHKGIPQVYRFRGHLIYLKISPGHQAGQMMQQFVKMGASFKEAGGWMEVNLFHKHKEFNLGTHTFSLEKDTPEDIEKHLFEFYKLVMKGHGMKLEVEE